MTHRKLPVRPGIEHDGGLVREGTLELGGAHLPRPLVRLLERRLINPWSLRVSSAGRHQDEQQRFKYVISLHADHPLARAFSSA